jgi:hypothetical protein
MKIKECKNYFDKVSIMLGAAKKIDKNKSLIFSILVGLLLIIPFTCLFINLFMQVLGIKYIIFSLIFICGIIVLLIVSLVNALYYVVLNELIGNEKISFKKMFIAGITELFTIILIAIFIVLISIFVNFMLF